MKSAILTILLSMAPVIELRGGIPFGVSQGLSPLEACMMLLL